MFVDSNSFCTTGNGDANTIIKNTISQTHIFDPIYVCGNYNLVQNNTINSTSEAAIRLDDTCNPGVSGFFNNFSSNTLKRSLHHKSGGSECVRRQYDWIQHLL